MNEWISTSEKAEAGHRIVALYADGSGASLFLATQEGYLDAEEGEQYDFELSEYGYSCWAYAPDGTVLWFESAKGEE